MTDGNKGKSQISYSSELGRKSIHLVSLCIPIIYLNINHVTGILILVAMTVTSFAMDLLRHWHAPSRQLLMKVVGPLLRKHEVESDPLRLTGATWVLIAATLSLSVFPTIVGVTAFTVLIVSDTCAALVGRLIKTRPFFDKSLGGSTVFAVSAVIVVGIYASIFDLPTSFIIAGAFGAVISAIVEAASVTLRMDDNISIPFSFAITLMISEWVALELGAQSFIWSVL